MRLTPTVLVLSLAAVAFADDPVTDDPATWPADVKAAYDEIVALPATAKDKVKTATFELAGKGRLARPALAAIAHQADLPEPHRAFAGILSAHFARFDMPALRQLAADANPFAQREAIVLLGKIGGKENADFLKDLAGKTESEGLKKHITQSTAGMPEEALPARALTLLDAVVNADAETKKRSAVAVSEDFGKAADPSLRAIVQDLTSDDDARTYAAAALVHVHSGNVAELESLCDRKYHKNLRYLAVRELAKNGEAGTAALKKLLEDATEPLKPQIEKLLEESQK